VDRLRVPLRALTPHLLALAFPDECPPTFAAGRVNWIYRPTLPPMWWFAVPLA
jgi:hypothetical protein